MRRALAIAVGVLLAAPPAASALPRDYVLPGRAVFPEGVTTRPGSSEFYVSSTMDGTIFRGTLGRRTTQRFLAPGRDRRTTAVGLRATRTRLVVAGGATRLIFVYDLRTRRLVRRFSASGTSGFLNDVAIAPNGDAYVTDSDRGLLFRLPARSLARRVKATRAIRPFLRVGPTPVGSFANGVVPAGRRYLLVIGTSTGVLGRVDLRTKQVTAVDLGGPTLPGGDGLARRGGTVYAVNAARQVAELHLSADWSRGRIVRQIRSSRLRYPTTLTLAGRRLLVVNSQFDARGGTPTLPFTVSALGLP